MAVLHEINLRKRYVTWMVSKVAEQDLPEARAKAKAFAESELRVVVGDAPVRHIELPAPPGEARGIVEYRRSD